VRFAIAALPHTFPASTDPSTDALRRHWQDAESQAELRGQLTEQFDGFAVAVSYDTQVEHPEIWGADPVALWSHLVPPVDVLSRRRRATVAVVIRSARSPLYEPELAVHSAHIISRGHMAMPDEWNRWVIAHLGAIPGEDTVTDYFTQQPLDEFTNMIPLERSHS